MVDWQMSKHLKDMQNEIPICTCKLKPEHTIWEHDWCCQICGGNHTERICPHRSKKK